MHSKRVKPVLRMFSGASTAFVGRVGFYATGFLFNLVAARLCGAAALGALAFALSLITLFHKFPLAGLQSGILKFVPPHVDRGEWESAGKIIGLVLIFVGLTTSIFCIPLFLAAKNIMVMLHKPDLVNFFRVSLLAIPLTSLNLICFYSFRASRHIEFETLLDGFVLRLLKVLLVVFGLYIVGGTFGNKWILLYSFLFSEIAVFAMSIMLLAKKAKLRFDFRARLSSQFRSIQPVLVFSMPMMFSHLVQTGFSRSDIIIIGYFMDVKSIGIYQVAVQLSMVIVLFLNSFGSIIAPMIAEDWNKGDMVALKSHYSLAAYWITVSTLPLFIVMVLFPENFLAVFGPDYIAGKWAFVILAIGQMVNSITGQCGYMLMLTGRQKLFFVDSLIAAIIAILLSILLIPKYGLEGGAVASAVGFAGVNVLRVGQVLVIHGIHPYSTRFLKPILSGALASLACLGFSKLVGQNGLWELTFLFLICAIFYFGTMWLTGFEEEEKLVLRALRRKFGLFPAG